MTRAITTLRIAFFLAFFAATAARADYSVDWRKIAGGGGVTTGGVWSVSGTIGQHDASGPLTGGSYSLTGGFWALFAIQTPGSPLLRIFLSGTNTAVVAWPTNSGPFSLQQKDLLGMTNWANVTNAQNLVGAENQVIVSPSVGARFYRLRWP